MTQDATGYNEESSEEIVKRRKSSVKKDTSCSFLSQDTQDIQEERADNSKFAKIFLLALFGLNVALSIWYLVVVIELRGRYIPIEEYLSLPLGFATTLQTFKTIPVFLLVLYSSLIFMYLPVLVKILGLFRIAYPEDYNLIKIKLRSFLIFYELFLLLRAIDYYFRTWVKYKVIYRWAEISYYVLEMSLIVMTTYTIYKNIQSENDDRASRNLKSSFLSVAG